MSSVSATRRASSTAPSAQQASSRCTSGIFGRSGHTLSVTPITSWPACFNNAAVTELSTPPDIPTITFAIGGILSEADLDQVADFVRRVGLGDPPRAHVWLVGQAHEHVERREIGRQTDVGRRRPRLAARVRVVIRDHVQAEIIQLVVDAQLVTRIHVVVHWRPASRSDAGVAIAEDAAVSFDLFCRISHPKDAGNFALAATQDATHLVGVAFARVIDQLLPQVRRKDERSRAVRAAYHHTLLRTVS